MKGGQALLFCAVAALCACNKDPGAAPTPAVVHIKPKAPAPTKAGPTAAEQTVGMVQAAVQGKSQVPVELKFDLAQRPKVGQRVDVNLALIAQISASPVSIQVSGSDGMTLSAGSNELDIPVAEAGEVYRHTLSVTPTAEGVLLIGVTVSLKHDEVTDQRVFSIPIIVDR
jgi:hypothetical protein